jgi:transmembrane sensor
MRDKSDISIDLGPSAVDKDALSEQASVWVTLLMSGRATADDAEALQRWRGRSPAHRQAFAEAKLLWDVLGPASEAVSKRMVPSGVLAGAMHTPLGTRHRLARRAFIGGALAASAAAVAYVGSKPPFGFWPSVDELRADYRTGIGEQRQLALTNDISLILNTQTSIDLRNVSTEARRIELVAGEAAIVTKGGRPLSVIAAGGWAKSSAARFDVRRDGTVVRVTCLDGNVEVGCRDRSVTVISGQQVAYDASGLQQVETVDISSATAWQRGQLIFRHEPFARVIEEVNRYRPGRIILLNAELGRRDVVATFQLSRINDVVANLAEAFGADTRWLPGGLVLMS